MNLLRDPRGRSSAVPSVLLGCVTILVTLLGCSSRPSELVGPSKLGTHSVEASASIVEPSQVLAPPLDRHKAPRLRVWTADWKGVVDQGVSLEPNHIHELVVPAGQPVTFHWAARPASGILGSRWALDLLDLFDETPRGGPDDLAHWSVWSNSESSATVGPFAAGPDAHDFYVMVRDDVGFVTLVVVRVRTSPARG